LSDACRAADCGHASGIAAGRLLPTRGGGDARGLMHHDEDGVRKIGNEDSLFGARPVTAPPTPEGGLAMAVWSDTPPVTSQTLSARSLKTLKLRLRSISATTIPLRRMENELQFPI